MKLGEKIKAIFAKAQDDALKLAEEAEKLEPTPAKTKDMVTETSQESKGFVSMDDMKAYFDAKFDEMKGEKKEDKPADAAASTQPTEGKPAEVKAVDEEVAPSLEERLKKLEEMVAKMLEKEAVEDGGDDEVTDEESESEEVEDEDCNDEGSEEEGELVGDSAELVSRVEILAPGMKAEGKDVKLKALVAAYQTKDGKAVIDQFTGGKAPTGKDENFVNTIFIGASEVLKSTRSTELSRTKTRDFNPSAGTPKGAMSAEAMNEFNAKYYEKSKQ